MFIKPNIYLPFYASVTDATHPHLEVTVSNINPTVVTLDVVVVVGNATPFASNEAPQESVRGVPSSLIRIISLWKFVGVPERFVVKDVTFVARAVIEWASTLSVLIVGVADDVSVLTRRAVVPENPE